MIGNNGIGKAFNTFPEVPEDILVDIIWCKYLLLSRPEKYENDLCLMFDQEKTQILQIRLFVDRQLVLLSISWD